MTTAATSGRDQVDTSATSLGAVLAVTFLASLSTGVFWNAIAFIAKHGYDFGQVRNLVLYGVMGVVYAVGAFGAGRFTRLVARRVTPRAILAVALGGQAACCVLPVAFDGEWALWVAAAGASIAFSVLWPIVESFLTAGRHGRAMRSAIGWFNLTWMPAVGLPLLLMPPIIERHAEWAIGAVAGTALLALVPLARFGARPGHHDPGAAAGSVSGEYPLLLRAARVLLPLSYVLNAAMSPILPYRFEAIGADVRWETPATATWMFVRVLAMIAMWRTPWWHGRWGTLLLGGAAMSAGFATVVLAPTLPLMLAGFAGFGVGMGVVYYAALYYAMSVGRAEVDAGGTHEGLIGAGYAVGPVAGLIGVGLGGGAWIVGIVFALTGVGSVGAVGMYVRARRERKSRKVEKSKSRNP